MAGLPSWSEVHAAMEARRDAIVTREEEKRMRRWDVKAMRALRRWCFKLVFTSVPPPPMAHLNPTHTTGGRDCSCNACRYDTSKPLSAASQPQGIRFINYVIEPGCSPRKVESVFGCDGTVIMYV
jgi:hypothetical protein